MLRGVLDLLDSEAGRSSKRRSATTLAHAAALDAQRRSHSNGHGPAPAPFPHKVKLQRQRSADFLAQFDQKEPRSMVANGMGSLVRRGYLKRKGGGYVRTAKEYTV